MRQQGLSVFFLLLVPGVFSLLCCTRDEGTSPAVEREGTPPSLERRGDADPNTSEARSSGPGDDELIIQIMSPFPSLNPLTYRYSHEGWILQYLRSPLYMMNKSTLELEPELAVGMPEMSADKLVWTIRLRPDARWHDGEPVTAKDIEASVHLLKDEAVDAARFRSLFDKLVKVTVLDDHAFQFTYSEPYYFSLQYLVTLPLVPAHVVDELEKPSDWNRVKDVVGCGPYRLESWTNEGVVVVRNEDWFGEKPNLKRITYRVIRDTTAAVTALRRGEIDAMGVLFEHWRRDLSRDRELLSKFHQLRYHRPFWYFLGWNSSRPLFSDKRTRKALTMLIDIQAYIDGSWFPGSKRITGPFFFKGPQYDSSIEPLPFDPQKAVSLLEEVGWRDTDGDGTRDRDGEKFEFTLLFGAGMPFSEHLVTAVKEALRKVGIQVTLRGLDSAAFSEQLKQTDFDCVAHALSSPFPEDDPYQVWHSDAIEGRGHNSYHFRSAEADRLIEQARVEFDDGKRSALYRQLHRIIYEEQPFTFVFTPEFLFLVDGRFQNVRSYRLGVAPRIGMEWWVRPGEEKRKRTER